MIKNWKLDHITMAVHNHEKATEKFTSIFGGEFIRDVAMESLGAHASFVDLGEAFLAMESPLREDSDMAKFLTKKGEGIHHLAFTVENIAEVESYLKEKGLKLIGPQVTENIKTDIFIHPKDCFGVLIQLTEWEEPYKSNYDKRKEVLGEVD